MWSRKLLAFQCQRQRQRQQQRKDGCPDGTSTARAGFRFVGLLLAGVWHCLSGDLPPPPPAPAWPRARPENSDAGTDRSCHHCNPGRRPCPLEGASRFFFSSSRPLTPEQTYTSGRTPLGPLPSCHCAVSCLVSPCDSAPKTADCRPPTVDDCRPLAPDLQAALESSTPRSAYPGLLLSPDFSRLQPPTTTTGVAAETRKQLTRAIISTLFFLSLVPR